MTFYLWSETAASNADADPTINFREGQAPTTYNNSTRAMMAAAAKFRNDISGVLITTGGSSTAYTVSSHQAFGSLSDGLFVAFTPHVMSGANPTLNVDSLGAKPLRGIAGQALPAGVLSQGTPYMASYEAGAQEWLLMGFYEPPGGVPIGATIDYWGDTAPNASWVFPFGQTLSRATYPTLFARFGTIHGAGDGSTTFGIMDCRGRVCAGKDDMGGASANRLTNQPDGLNGDTLGAAGGLETHQLTAAQLPANIPNSAVSSSSSNAVGLVGNTSLSFQNGGSNTTPTNSQSVTPTITTTTTVTINPSGGGSHNNVQPTIICNKLLRVL